MSREFDDIRKKIDQSNKELYKQDSEISKNLNEVSKNQNKMLKEIMDIKKEVKDIAFKVDTMLEILNNFSIMLVEDEEDLEDNYSYSDTNKDDEDTDEWIPEQKESWNSYDNDDDDDEEHS